MLTKIFPGHVLSICLFIVQSFNVQLLVYFLSINTDQGCEQLRSEQHTQGRSIVDAKCERHCEVLIA